LAALMRIFMYDFSLFDVSSGSRSIESPARWQTPMPGISTPLSHKILRILSQMTFIRRCFSAGSGVLLELFTSQ
jgi:hypothetical protein